MIRVSAGELRHRGVEHHCSSKLEVGAVDDVMEALANVKMYDRAAKDVSCVVQCQLDVWSYIGYNIVPQWDGMRYDFSDVLLVEGRVFSFSAVNVEVVELFFFSSRRRHTRWTGDWSSDVCSSDLTTAVCSSTRGGTAKLTGRK